MIRAKGPLLTVDVGARKSREVEIDDALDGFIGGRGVATRLAHDRIPFDADPWGPENRVYFSTGPLQQTRMSFTGRMNATALSPLTDGLLSSNAGGYLSRNFAATGHPCVEIVGESAELLVVHVTDAGVEFEIVSELVEATVPEVTDYVKRERGLDAEHVLCIGPAGENLARYASVMTSETRAFGRGGIGAVLGSKRIKAMTFEGDAEPEIAFPEEMQMNVHRKAATSDDIMKRQGTTAGTEILNSEFSLPTRYFSEYSFEGAADIGGEAVEEKKYKKGACSQCAFACKLPTRDEESGLETEGPEYETVYAFGSSQGVDNIVDVMKSNKLCDIYGLDTISCGVTVAAYLAANDEFGNAELAHDLVEKIAYRVEEGDMLADGLDRVHDRLGVENFSVKGLEVAGHDGRVVHGAGFSYAVANRGADHMYSTTHRLEYNGEIEPEGLEGKPEVVRERENRAAVRDSAIVCAFGEDDYVTADVLEELLKVDYDRLLTIGDRVVELERHFNNKRGKDRDSDRLPYELPEIEDALDEYYALREWNEDGTVPDENIARYT